MRRRLNLTGLEFGWLTVLEYYGNNRHGSPVWKCQCRCGKQVVLPTYALTHGHTKSCGCWPNGRPIKPGREATVSPTPMDIAWAAGIYEGEGHCGHTKQNSDQLEIVQNDTWILEKLKTLFGGLIFKARNTHRWYICGPRARGFLMTIYKFLSPWRQTQALRCLEKNEV